MFHTSAWSQSITSTAMAARNAVADPVTRVSGVDVLVPDVTPFLKAAYAMGVDIAQAQLQSPSLRRRYPFDIAPTDEAATPTGPDLPMVDLWEHPIQLDPSEQLEAFLANEAAGANLVRCLVFLGDDKDEVPAGEIFTIRATGSATLVAETWTNFALTLANLLPAGTYAVVGARFQSATAIAGRLVFPSGQTPRPGAPGVIDDPQVEHPRFRYGRAGVWGTFTNVAPPTVDMLATAGDTSEVVHLDLIKTG